MSYEIVGSDYPIVYVRFFNECTLPELHNYLRDIEAWMARGRQAHILDFTTSEIMKWEVQQAVAAWIKEARPLIRESVIGSAIVVPSPIARFIVSTIMAMTPFAVPTKTFSTVEEALPWIQDSVARDPGTEARSEVRRSGSGGHASLAPKSSRRTGTR
jgi:hypothetical protein